MPSAPKKRKYMLNLRHVWFSNCVVCASFQFLTVLDVLAMDLDAMNDAMVQFHVRPRDALHYAAMKRIGCFDLASNDATLIVSQPFQTIHALVYENCR